MLFRSKSVSLVKANDIPADECLVFQGFMDFLTAVTLGVTGNADCLVLNSVANVEKDVYKRQPILSASNPTVASCRRSTPSTSRCVTTTARNWHNVTSRWRSPTSTSTFNRFE